ncbi:MAG: NAD(P)H-quinone oxidoreductase [Polyangiaceae bacterium]|nr:NAD(P)H-quinone oxidoreductase [Polyangiaceae bacterium]
MKAIVPAGVGGPEVLKLAEAPDPELGEDEVLVRVRATALNRADLLQRRGLYPPPPGVTNILGLEFSGVVERLGARAEGVAIGDQVMGLLPGGGYAELAATHPRTLLPIPAHLSFEEAAGIPEAFLTANEALFTLGRLEAGETVLIHAAAGGVGSAAVQLAKASGARTLAVVGSEAKAAFVRSLGADDVVVRTGENWQQEVLALGGFDVALDFVGKSCAALHAKGLRSRGRWVVLGFLSGSQAELELKWVLSKRLEILGLVMRTRTVGEKIALTERFVRERLPLFAGGQLRPLVDSVFPLAEAAQAHERLERNENLGKLVLRVG